MTARMTVAPGFLSIRRLTIRLPALRRGRASRCARWCFSRPAPDRTLQRYRLALRGLPGDADRVWRVNIQLGRGHCPAYGLRSSAQYLVAFVPNEFVVPAEEAVIK